MSTLSWGKNRILVKDLDGGKDTKWVELPTPAEDSTELTTNEGDKLEAKLEGGDYEDVKYKNASYELKYDVRNAKPIPITHSNGVVKNHFAVVVIPEDETTISLYVPKSSISATTSYTAADGFKTTFTHSALKPDTGTDLIRLGKIEVTKNTTGTTPNTTETLAVKFYEVQPDGSYSKTAENL